MFDTQVPLYGIFIIISFICGLFVVYGNAKRFNFRVEEIISLLIFVILGAIFGAKYYTFLANPKEFNGIFNFEKVGLSSYGAVIGIIILLIVFSKLYKKSFKHLILIMLPSIPLMYGIGKIGCFFAGCCYGIEYNGPLSIIYNYSYSAPSGIELFPVQLLEAVVFIGIFIYVFYKSKKDNYDYFVVGQVLMLCGISKFLLDFLRKNQMKQVLTVNQIVSIIFVLIGICLLIIKRNKRITDNM